MWNQKIHLYITGQYLTNSDVQKVKKKKKEEEEQNMIRRCAAKRMCSFLVYCFIGYA